MRTQTQTKITTIEEMRELPDGALVRTATGEFGETLTYRDGRRILRFTKASIGPSPFVSRHLPATVLFTPEAGK